jgi:parvulin-like peptidyl-prolyl isomerase
MLRKMLALVLGAMMLAGSMAAMAEAVATPVEAVATPVAQSDVALATVNGEPVMLSEAQMMIPQLSDYMTDATDYQYVVDFLIRQRVMEKKIKDMGFDVFTAEEMDAFAKDAQAQWEQGIENYVSYYLSEDTQEARDALRVQAEAYYQAQGFGLEELTLSVKNRAAIDRMSAYLIGGYVPTQEEIDAAFQQFGLSYQQNYENNVMAYEYNTLYNQQTSWYTPEGYRGIIHILLQPDTALMDSYTQLTSAFEEQQSALGGEQAAVDPAATATVSPAVSAEPVTQQMVDAARQAILDSVKAQTDEIYAKLAAGETFESLIAQYGKDPGMSDETSLKDGYMVHKDSVVWDPAFTAGAFSGKMAKVGDVSDPLVSANGVHILKYLRDVPSGLIMTDAIKLEIADYLKATKENAAYEEAYASWVPEMTITYNQEAITQATAAAKALQPEETVETQTLEALPAADETPVTTEAVATTAP